MRRRAAVVTGMGAVSPLGVGSEEMWAGLLAGRVGTAEVTQFSTDRYMSRQGGEVPGFEPAPFFRALDSAALPRSTQLAVAAARLAVADAALPPSTFDDAGERAGMVMGLVVANRPGMEGPASRLRAGHVEAGLPLAQHDAALVVEAPAIELGVRGSLLVLPTACAAGNNAIGCGADWIADGRADVVLAGATDELSPTMFMMFSVYRSLSPDVVRPFDRERRGLLLSEGAGVLVLEAEEHARARGARIYGRVAGHGNFADAHDMTHPHPDGLGARLSMQAALRESGLAPSDIQYVSAHGTGTPANDGIEARAIREVFGAHTDHLPVSSAKSMLGHAQGAASALEAIACLLAIRDNVVPPTMNHRVPDPDCPIDIVPNQARPHRVEAAMNNAFGFGGNICCVVFTRS